VFLKVIQKSTIGKAICAAVKKKRVDLGLFG
jgi:hypothetical protein